MRLVSLPLPTLLSGLVAVLVGYASSAALIWQAALATGATAEEIAGWMTALGIAMGISTLVLTLWYRAPVLTAWSTPGAALLVTGLQGVSLPDAVGIFIVANALIVLCGVTGLFARLMRIIPHSLAAAMLAGILLRFGLQAFGTLNGEFLIGGSMLLAWLLFKVSAPRYAVIAAMLAGILTAFIQGKLTVSGVHFAPALPVFVAPHFSLAHILSVAVPLFLVTMASQNAPGVATMKASGYQLPVSPLIVFTGVMALLLSPFGVYSICIAAITAAICQSPDAHPDPKCRWLAAAAAGVFYLLAGWLGGSITSLMAALPVSWVQMLAGLALLNTISGSLYQALTNEKERDATIIAFLVTASGLTLTGIGSAFWGVIAGGIGYVILMRCRRLLLPG
ncbi:benzoate/H(+) symporter BenE family transporter [Salmonella bongori serovar 66:z39:-]|uniref:benzoate/H(+) symporter BenE family transporter n=1 Tax=Salmonella bongori TaxID=54736 RepID=UPI0015E81138|nr:benzoate/H(+) symporter BenE family transporter [Salmonella bongori]MBA2136291.1 benzoate/H(+) symporter BenE family transporter [Salmonella bongori serovar 66:z39:-]